MGEGTLAGSRYFPCIASGRHAIKTHHIGTWVSKIMRPDFFVAIYLPCLDILPLRDIFIMKRRCNLNAKWTV